MIDSNGDALTYVKARHFQRERSQNKTISLGSPIREVVHGSEMFGLIADDGSFRVIKSNGQTIRNVLPSSVADKVTGASMTKAAYVFLKADGFAKSGGLDISGGQLDKSGETISGYDMSELMGGSVVDIVSTENAFVAVLDDFFAGVPTLKGDFKGDNSNLWGWPKDAWGGDVVDVEGDFDQLWTNRFAVVGLRSDGSVKAWGHKGFGGRLSAADVVQIKDGQLVDVMSTSTAFAAVTRNALVLAWGDRGNGGEIPGEIDLHSRDVDRLIASEGAFLALKTDGTVVAWGNASAGGEIPRRFRDQLTGIKHIYAANYGFVAISEDEAFSWGSPYIDNQKVALPKGHLVKKVVSSAEAFAVLTDQGSVLAWGNEGLGGKPMKSIRADLRSGIKDLAATYGSMAAITDEGDLLAWGDSEFGGRTERFTPAVPASHFG